MPSPDLQGMDLFTKLGLPKLGDYMGFAGTILQILLPLTGVILFVLFIWRKLKYQVHVNVSSKVGHLGEKGFGKFDSAKIVNDKRRNTVYLYLKKHKRKLPMPPPSCFMPVRSLFYKWRLDLEQINELDFIAQEPPNLKHPYGYKEIDLKMLPWWLSQAKETRDKFIKRSKLEAYIPAISMIICLIIVGIFTYLMVGMLIDGLNNVASQLAAIKSQQVVAG